MIDLRREIEKKDDEIEVLKDLKSKKSEEGFKTSNELDWVNIENNSLLDWNRELNGDIDTMHSKIRMKEAEMHNEQEEWISKYHN